MIATVIDARALAEVAVRSAEGRWTLIFCRDLRQAPTKVWAALTDPDQLAQWAPFLASRDLTTTPRQRIVLRRELARQPAGSPVAVALEREYAYDGLATCAADGTCAPGTVLAGVVCRTAAGPCDDPETCDGASPSCPPDAFSSAGTVCKPAAGECDPADTCSGDAADCPPLVSPDGAPCSQGTCEGGACKSQGTSSSSSSSSASSNSSSQLDLNNAPAAQAACSFWAGGRWACLKGRRRRCAASAPASDARVIRVDKIRVCALVSPAGSC